MKTRYYSPRIDRDLVSALYHLKETQRIPMTKLTNRLIRAALRYEGALGNEPNARVAEQSTNEPSPKQRKP